MYNFDYIKPGSVADAIAALGAEDAQPLGGGQTLIPTMKQRLAQPSKLVDLSGLAEIRGIKRDGDTLVIGAATTHAEVAESADVQGAIPGLAHLAGNIGDPQVRNKGTLGGSLANNDPAACYPSAVLALGATVHTNRRTIAADDYFQGMFTTALEEGEIITAVAFPVPQGASYQKFVQPASRFALTGVFVAKFPVGVRVAITGAGEGGVFRHAGLEAALSSDFSSVSAGSVEISADGLIHDLHGTPDYRANIISVMTKRAVAAIG